MWQADTFNPAAIDRELAWAKQLGFNSMRVFLHHLLWEQDKEGFLGRMDKFLAIADKHGIGVMFVLFDSCWDPNPKLGKQRPPQPGLHNSGWVQSPGAKDLADPARRALLEAYVKGVVGRFKDDRRVQVWDLWNEPDNTNDSSYGRNNLKQEPADKHALTLDLLQKAFAWARDVRPSQPLTSGLWLGAHKADPAKLIPIEKVQLAESDVISFHCYGKLDEMKQWIESLRRHGRPLLCTEYMARAGRQHVRPDPRLPQGAGRRRVQLGLRGRQVEHHLPLGFLAEALRRRTQNLVPRHLPPRRQAVRSAGGRVYPAGHGAGEEGVEGGNGT